MATRAPATGSTGDWRAWGLRLEASSRPHTIPALERRFGFRVAPPQPGSKCLRKFLLGLVVLYLTPRSQNSPNELTSQVRRSSCKLRLPNCGIRRLPWTGMTATSWMTLFARSSPSDLASSPASRLGSKATHIPQSVASERPGGAAFSHPRTHGLKKKSIPWVKSQPWHSRSPCIVRLPNTRPVETSAPTTTATTSGYPLRTPTAARTSSSNSVSVFLCLCLCKSLCRLALSQRWMSHDPDHEYQCVAEPK